MNRRWLVLCQSWLALSCVVQVDDPQEDNNATPFDPEDFLNESRSLTPEGAGSESEGEQLGCSPLAAVALEQDVGGIVSKPVVVGAGQGRVAVVWLQEAGPNEEIRAIRFDPREEPPEPVIVKPSGDGREVSGRTVSVVASPNGYVASSWREASLGTEGRNVFVLAPDEDEWRDAGSVELPRSLARPWEDLSLAVSNDGELAMFWVTEDLDAPAGLSLRGGEDWSTLMLDDVQSRPFLEFSPSGVLHLVYSQRETGAIVLRTYDGGGLSDAETVADDGAAPQVRIAQDGNVLVAWRQVDAGDYSLFTRWKRGGEWQDSAVVEMETDPVDAFHLALAPNGNAAIGWCTNAATYSGRPHAISYDAEADTWSPSGELASLGGCTEPVAGVNSDGRTAFTWNAQLHKLKTSYLTEAGWSDDQLFGGRGLWASMVVTEAGDVVRTWSVGEDEDESDLMLDVCATP